MSFKIFLESPYASNFGRDISFKCPNIDHKEEEGIIFPVKDEWHFDYAAEFFGQPDNIPKKIQVGYTDKEFNELEKKHKLNINLGRFSSNVVKTNDDYERRYYKHILNIINLGGGEIPEGTFRGFIPFFCKKDGAIFILDFSKPSNNQKCVSREAETSQELFFCDILKRALATEKNDGLKVTPFILGKDLQPKN